MKDLIVGLTKPTIHMNGTSRKDLAACLEDASRALTVAIDKIQTTAPNGRDYYPQGEGANGRALVEHLGRMKMIIEVKRDIDELWMHVEGA